MQRGPTRPADMGPTHSLLLTCLPLSQDAGDSAEHAGATPELPLLVTAYRRQQNQRSYIARARQEAGGAHPPAEHAEQSDATILEGDERSARTLDVRLRREYGGRKAEAETQETGRCRPLASAFLPIRIESSGGLPISFRIRTTTNIFPDPEDYQYLSGRLPISFRIRTDYTNIFPDPVA